MKHLNTTRTLLMAMVVASVAGCSRYRAFPKPAPAQGDGIRVVLRSAEGKKDYFSASLIAYNDTDTEIAINRNQIAVVAPDGSAAYRTGWNPVHRIKPHGKHAVNVKVEGTGVDYKKVAGLFLRFDGVWAGNIRVHVPAIALGEPTHSAGNVNTSFTPPEQKETRLSRREKKRREKEQAAGGGGGGGLQTYSGPRSRVSAEGLKCAAMPLQAKNVSEQVAFIIDELLLTELQNVGFEAIGPDDVNAMLGFENVKDAAGCDDASCIAEIGNALGVPYLAAGNVAALEGSTVITLKLIDVQNTRVVARSSRIADGGTRVLPRIMAEAVQELVQRSQL